MKHKKDGIALTEVKMSTGGKGGRAAGSVLRLFMALSGGFGTVFTLVESLSLKLDTNIILIALCGMTAAFFLMFTFRQYLWFTISASFLALSLFLIKEWEYLKNGLWCLENAYINRYNEYTNQHVLRYIVELDPVRSLTVLFAPILYLVTMIFAMAVLGLAGKGTVLLIVLPFILTGLTVGQVPAAMPFLCCLCTFLFLFGMARVPEAKKKTRSGISAAAGGICVAAGLLLFALFHALIPEEKYPVTEIREKKSSFLSAVQNMDGEKLMLWLENGIFSGLTKKLDRMGLFEGIGMSTVGDGGLGGGKLGRVDQVVFDHQTALRVQVPVSDSGFYLRGYVGVHYEGDRWDGLTGTEEKALLEFEKNRGEEEFGFDSRNQSAEAYRLMEENPDLWLLDGPDSTNTVVGNNFTKARGRVINVSANPYYYYVPYGTDYDSMDGLDQNVLYGRPSDRNRTDYLFTFYRPKSGEFTRGFLVYPSSWSGKEDEKLNAYIESEHEYASMVEQIYLEVPEGLEEVWKIAEEIEKAAEPAEIRAEAYLDQMVDKYQAAAENQVRFSLMENRMLLVYRYLERNMRYTLSPGRLPEGKDFVTYFLTQSKQGYCSYFASAAVILLRMVGVPARYAEGYLVSGEDIANASVLGQQAVEEFGPENRGTEETLKLQIDVPDVNAHAWVEVYVRGFGWMPVEMTSGFMDALASGVPTQEESPPQTEPAHSEETKPQETIEDPGMTETSEPAQTTASQESEETDGNGDGAGGQTGIRIPDFVWKIAAVLAALAALWGIGVLAGTLKERRILEAYRQEDTNAAVLVLYKRCRKLLRYCTELPDLPEDLPEYAAGLDSKLRTALGFEMDTCRFMDIAVRSRFAKESVPEEDRKYVLDYYTALKKVFYQTAPAGKQFFARYILRMNSRS